MPRRREVPVRQVLPDPKFHNTMLTKFVNMIMLDGKKSVAEGIMYGAIDTMIAKGKTDARSEERSVGKESRSRRSP